MNWHYDGRISAVDIIKTFSSILSEAQLNYAIYCKNNPKNLKHLNILKHRYTKNIDGFYTAYDDGNISIINVYGKQDNTTVVYTLFDIAENKHLYYVMVDTIMENKNEHAIWFNLREVLKQFSDEPIITVLALYIMKNISPTIYKSIELTKDDKDVFDIDINSFLEFLTLEDEGFVERINQVYDELI